MTVTIDIQALYGEVPKLADSRAYVVKAMEQAGEGHEVVLAGRGSVWLYFLIAHVLLFMNKESKPLSRSIISLANLLQKVCL